MTQSSSTPPIIPPDLLMRAYRSGIFPMADARDDAEIFWVEPKRRAILPLDRFRCSHSLAKVLRRDRFRVTCNTAFEAVVSACAAPRPAAPNNQDGESWISHRIQASYAELHRLGLAHSIECWHGEDLVGGLYGVGFDRVFCGESMFSRMTDASKVALAWLVAALRRAGAELLDCQFITDHLASMGAIEITQAQYLKRLAKAQLVAVSGASAAGARTGAGTGADAAAGLAAEGFLPLPLAFAALLDAASAGSASPGKCIAQSFTHTS
jgi:leucyl/phenylalanyl-tRNA--protein transferase